MTQADHPREPHCMSVVQSFKNGEEEARGREKTRDKCHIHSPVSLISTECPTRVGFGHVNTGQRLSLVSRPYTWPVVPSSDVGDVGALIAHQPFFSGCSQGMSAAEGSLSEWVLSSLRGCPPAVAAAWGWRSSLQPLRSDWTQFPGDLRLA